MKQKAKKQLSQNEIKKIAMDKKVELINNKVCPDGYEPEIRINPNTGEITYECVPINN